MTRLIQLFADQFSTGLDLAIRSGLVLALASVATLLMRRSSAAARHLVWSASLVGVLVMPILSMAIPFEMPVPLTFATNTGLPVPTTTIIPNQDFEAPLIAAATANATVESDSSLTGLLPRPNVENAKLLELNAVPSQPLSRNRFEISWSGLAVGLWLVGAIACSLPWILGCLSLWRLRRVAGPLPLDVAEELKQLASSLLGKCRVLGLQSASRNIPMTWGFWQPVVLLPADAAEWSAERRRLVLLHELAHIRRRDCCMQWLGQLVRTLHWFNPLAWWALNRLRLEQEQACDDTVLSSGAAAEDYAAELLSVTARLPRMSWDSAVALAMGRATRLEQRLNAILDERRNRRTPSAPRIIVGLAALCGLIVTLAIVQPRTVSAQVVVVAQEKAPERSEPKKPDAAKEPRPVQVEQVEKVVKPEAAAPDQGQEQLRLESIIELIEKNSANPTNSSELSEAAIRGMMESLKDPYSTFLPKQQLDELYGQFDAKIVGIGAALSLIDGKVLIELILPNSPALASQMKAGDEILSINGQPVPAKLDQAAKAIRGPSGTEVALKIRRGTEELTVTLTRREVLLSPIRGLTWNEQGQQHWLDASQKLAYIQVTEFSKLTVPDLKAALQKLKDQGCQGLVLDLRNNPGGMLTACVEVAELFMNRVPVVTTRGPKEGERHQYFTGPATVVPDLPLAVVVDRYTASAAEVLTAALKDNKRVIVVGERTFGKGSVQSILQLPANGAAIKLTTAQMLTPAGAALHHEPGSKDWGVDPHDGYFVPLSAEQRATRLKKQADRHAGRLNPPQPLTAESIEKELADPALAAAMQTLQAKVKSGEFTKTGRPVAELHVQLAQQDELRKQRDEFRKKLDQINAELGEK